MILLFSINIYISRFNSNDLPVAHVKRGIRGVLLNDMQMLKDAILDVENVFTVCIIIVQKPNLYAMTKHIVLAYDFI